MGERILVVDDEESIRNIVSEVLNEAGYEVTCASNGEEALETFRRNPFSLVLADIKMDGMSGIQLLEEIKKIQPDTQVVIMTSYVSMDTALSAMRSGAYDYVIKPFEDLELISAVSDRAIDKIRLLAENRVLVENLKRKNDELERLNGFLKEQASRDGLTGLYNHRYFHEALSIEVARSRRYEHSFSLIFLDVDHFKRYNDTHGHIEGDQVLHTLGNIFRERLRETNLAARYGGEEFVILLPETTKEGACIVAEDIRKVVEDFPFPGREAQPTGRLTVSLGVATFPEDAKDGSTVIQRADQALYRAKNEGRNRVRWGGEG